MPARFYVQPEEWDRCHLSLEESKHLTRVLRLRSGEMIELFDGIGNTALAQITDTQGKSVSYELNETQFTLELTPKISLYQSIPKGKNMDFVIQKAVELGVSEIIPIITTNTIAVAENKTRKTEKWQRIALEACKQCKQPWLPTLGQPKQLSELTEYTQDLRLVASLRDNAEAMKATLDRHPSPTHIAIFIGPEGDFTDEELDQIEHCRVLPVSLGNLTLRVETATLSMISALRFFYGAQ